MLSIAEYKVGMCAEIVRSFSESDVDLFSKLSGDENPVHLNEEYAKTTLFGRRIVHGALASSIFSALFANKLPGAGCIYLKFENKFLRPIYLNEKVIFKVEIIDNSKELCEINGGFSIYSVPFTFSDGRNLPLYSYLAEYKESSHRL